jgi:hypothetical protein
VAWCIETFIETFDGNGPFTTVDGSLSGFDNPDWTLNGTGKTFRDGGLRVENHPFDESAVDGDFLWRWVSGRGSFVERVEIKDPYLAPVDHFGAGVFTLYHSLDPLNVGANNVQIWVFENDPEPEGWTLGISAGPFLQFQDVLAGSHIALTIIFDDALSEASFSYDNDIDDEIPALSLGPFKYSESISETQASELFVSALEAPAYANGLIDYWSLTCHTAGVFGDFNNNSVLDAADIDLLSAAINGGTFDLKYDVNCDQFVNAADRDTWVTELKNTYFGDSDLDGEFGIADLVTPFQAGVYEDAIADNSGWASGDWNGDSVSFPQACKIFAAFRLF